MEDIMSKISGILSDEESVRQIAELAKMFKSGEFNEETPKYETDADCNADNGTPDIEQIMKLMSLVGTFNSQDKNTELLLALRPHLREEKQQKLDHAIKMLKIIAVYNIAKESGLINNLF
ncbi:MAG: hypothetical protein K2K91_05880 [Ruminococcus sp.]|nr:hypothetical protein [Ruminococcus sp.]MDE7099315.1 hypothetical protein [Ruminococcus sp.]